MANTYQLIASNTLGGSETSISFTSIPSTYTDLILKFSMRHSSNQANIRIRFNSDTGTNYSQTYLYGDGSAAASSRDSSQTYNLGYGVMSTSSYTANTFSNGEIYIPSYQVSQNKPLSISGNTENNATLSYISATAGLWRNTGAITSLEIFFSTGSAVADSSFWLYGIKNS